MGFRVVVKELTQRVRVPKNLGFRAWGRQGTYPEGPLPNDLGFRVVKALTQRVQVPNKVVLRVLGFRVSGFVKELTSSEYIPT